MLQNQPRIGVLGGTFDPVHIGHLRFARMARRRLRLDRVWMQPALRPGHRPGPMPAAAAHRAAMVALATQRARGLFLLPPEFGARPGRPTYTVELLEALLGDLPARCTLFFLLGMDAFCELESWHRWRELPKLATLVVADRLGTRRQGRAAAVERRLQRLGGGAATPVRWIEGVRTAVSASEIRSRARRGLSLAGRVPSVVGEYILKYGLYRDIR